MDLRLKRLVMTAATMHRPACLHLTRLRFRAVVFLRSPPSFPPRCWRSRWVDALLAPPDPARCRS